VRLSQGCLTLGRLQISFTSYRNEPAKGWSWRRGVLGRLVECRMQFEQRARAFEVLDRVRPPSLPRSLPGLGWYPAGTIYFVAQS
jgi:hypothetical protein